MTHESFPDMGRIGLSPAYTIISESKVAAIYSREVLIDGEIVTFESPTATQDEMRLWLDAQSTDEGSI